MTEKVNIPTEAADNGGAEAVNAAIAERLAALRKDRRLSFDQLSTRSGVSKGMLVQIEQGRANPSIGTLCRIAAGLRVSVAELVAMAGAERSPVRVVGRDGSRRLWAGAKGGSGLLLVGSNGPDMLELWAWEMHPGERFEAQAHSAGTQELIHVLEGKLALDVEGTSYVLETGSSAHARTDRAHAYACASPTVTRFTMVVFEPGRPLDSDR